MKRIPVIYDGDMGGDDLWAITLMLAHPDIFDVKGITTVFGNVDVTQATKNVCDLLAYLGHEDIPVYVGEDRPIQGARMFGDDAYGEGGVGGVFFPENNKKAESQSAIKFITQTLKNSNEPITLIGTGPMTNLALVIKDHPELHSKIKQVIVMGGAIKPGPHPNPPHRVGNITEAAEFNFFQDSFAPNIVAQSGIKLTVMTADANQQYALTDTIKERFRTIGSFGEMMIQMTSAVEHLDREKFGMDGPALHDPCVILYLLQQTGHETYYTPARKQGFHTIEEPEDWEKNGAVILNDELMNTWIITETINIPAIIDTLYTAIKSFA
ncbi:MAG: hypothetical protein CMH30_03370 [Micavibrio sp.]|nr:hypothetical protein [Micavibrio sp.]|tara:strand:- start:1658 stop:2632 length:975 start_codon:yes stop_codon:yes gene_type:complete